MILRNLAPGIYKLIAIEDQKPYSFPHHVWHLHRLIHTDLRYQFINEILALNIALAGYLVISAEEYPL